MSNRRVIISGLGPVSGLGFGIDQTWKGVVAGRSAIGPIQAFDASGFACRIASEAKDLKVGNHVPKGYRKAVKVMARDTELAVVAADLAARDAGLATKGTIGADDANQKTSYPATRLGAHIGAGLIAAELNELTAALVEARNEKGEFDIHKWGREGMNHLTPLWLLKYLPNMLACHVTIIHDAQGPSNTITCAEASGGLSIGESMRVIQRGAADVCFCGGAECKINPMAFLRQLLAGRLNTTDNERPGAAVRPFCESAAGTVIGEGGGIVVLEALDTFEQRQTAAGNRLKVYAEVAGFGASQTVHRESRNLLPDPEGGGLAVAMRAALRNARVGVEQIDMLIPVGMGMPAYDRAETAALQSVFGSRLGAVPVAPIKPMLGNCGAGMGGVDVSIAAKALAEQTVPARINCERPMGGVNAGSSEAKKAELRCVMVLGTGIGGQNTAIILCRFEK